MTNEYYYEKPMQAVELGFYVIIAKNPHLSDCNNNYINHPLIKKYSHMPFYN